jgi:dCMP deaminase
MECKTENYQWHDYFMDIAELTAKRSSVPTTQVGAVLVYDKRTISQGYNGYPTGFPSWRVVGRRRDWEVHSEINAIAWAARRGISTEGATLYVTVIPCEECSKALIQAGIKEIFTKRKEASKNFKSGLDLLKEADIPVHFYD